MICSTAFNVLVIIWATDYVRIIHLCWFIVLSVLMFIGILLLNLYPSSRIQRTPILCSKIRILWSEEKEKVHLRNWILEGKPFRFYCWKKDKWKKKRKLTSYHIFIYKDKSPTIHRGCKTTKETDPVRQGPKGEMKEEKRNKLLTFIIAITKP